MKSAYQAVTRSAHSTTAADMNRTSVNEHLVPKQQQYPSLNGVRGFAFLLVLLAHFSNYYGGPFSGLGKVGVWIFFTLSAFLLTRQFLEAPGEAFSRYGLANYAYRRFFRIVPLYVLTLIVYVPFGYVVTNANLIDHLLFQQGRGHLWTVIAEVKYYFLIPLLSFALLKLLNAPRVAAIFILLALWITSIIVFPPSSYRIDATSVTAYLCVFLAGSIAAFLFVRLGIFMSCRWADVAAAFALLVIVVTTPSVWSSVIEPVKGAHFYQAHPMFAIVGVGLILSAIRDGSWSAYLFSSAPLQFLGQISFSGYLIHPLLLKLTSWYAHSIGTPAAVLTSAAAVLIASSGLYITVERPLSKLRLRPSRTLHPIPS
jgi:peptidoglycan/LPS O-acetylase OafA/YrhL